MVDLVITAANVDFVSGKTKTLDASESVAVGDWVYNNTNTTVGVAANSDAAKDAVVGVALNAATANQPVTYALDGSIVTMGSATLTVGLQYVLSAAGACSVSGDSATSDYVTFLGHAITTSNLELHIRSTQLQQG